jgi:hypothetical protein
MLEKSLGEKISYKILNQAKNEIPHQSLNFSKIEKAFGWKPRFTISGTAEKMRVWYEDILS